MSVINKVLKDLDRRGQQPFSKNAASSAVERRGSHRFGLWLLASLIVITLALVFFWWQSSDDDVMTVTESEAADMPLVQERVEPLVDSSAFTVPTERADAQETGSREQTVIDQNNLASVAVSEPISEAKPAPESKEVEPRAVEEEPKATADNSSEEAEPSGEFSKRPVQLSPTEIAEQHIEKAQKAQQQGRLTSAEEHWRKALAVTPDNKNVRKKLAALQFGRNKVSQALTTLEAGFKRDPSDFEFRLLNARILEKEARPAAALSLLKQATPSATDYPDYVQKQALLAQEVGDYQTAANTYQRLIVAEPAQGRWYLGKALAQQEFAPQTALASYEEALTRITHRPTVDFIHQQIALLEANEPAGEQ